MTKQVTCGLASLKFSENSDLEIVKDLEAHNGVISTELRMQHALFEPVRKAPLTLVLTGCQANK
jgi:hypothetical protein